MKFFIKYFFSKCDQIPRKMRILSHWLKKTLMENFVQYMLEIMQKMWLAADLKVKSVSCSKQ